MNPNYSLAGSYICTKLLIDGIIKAGTVDQKAVIAALEGMKYQGLTGALLVEMPSGQRFKIGSGLRDADRAQPPAIGSTITYRFNGTHASGLPRFARYWRVRDGGNNQKP